ncbi:MAG: putative sulfate exporter family transporter [Methylovirgula sp.]
MLGLTGADLLGWAATAKIWLVPDTALAPIGKSYAALGGLPALVLTYVVFLAGAQRRGRAAARQRRPLRTRLFGGLWLASIAWIIGSYAHFAGSDPRRHRQDRRHLVSASDARGRLDPRPDRRPYRRQFLSAICRLAQRGDPAEFYVKIAIVILGGVIAITVAGKLNLASTVFLRSLAAIVEAYLIYWPVVYTFHGNISASPAKPPCHLPPAFRSAGVAAAIATGSAIRARPQVAVLVSSLVVVFAVVELLILPFLANAFLAHEPLVAASWLGLAVKTDGAAVAAGGIAESLISAKNAAAASITRRAGSSHDDDDQGFHRCLHRHLGLRPRPYLDDLHQSRGGGRKGQAHRNLGAFPKIHFGIHPDLRARPHRGAGPSEKAMRCRSKPSLTKQVSSASPSSSLTFFSIGVLSNFRRLWADGLGKLAAGLFRQPVRLRHLGRPVHLVDFLPRREAAARS